MFSQNKQKNVIILLLNFLIVAVLGVIMRYKIGFEFPYLDQKNLQQAHSHFAFTGWVSQSLLIIFLFTIKDSIKDSTFKTLATALWVHLFLSYAMLISFAATGYGVYSIIQATLSLVVFYFIALKSELVLRRLPQDTYIKLLRAAFLFGVISSLGTVSLSIMMATKNFEQHLYLASVYWYLHFQYNGYFLFMCFGFLAFYLKTLNIKFDSPAFKMLFISTFFTYGLSVLWLDLPWYLYIIVLVATIIQSLGFGRLIYSLYKDRFLSVLKSGLIRFLFRFLFIAISIKYLLQAGSTIPTLSHFAFGFRPVVIAYLHLVLLAIISVSIISFLVLNKFINLNRLSKNAIIGLCLAIFLNEIVLCLQGIGAIFYIPIPYVNTYLFMISLLLFSMVFCLLISQDSIFKHSKIQ